MTRMTITLIAALLVATALCDAVRAENIDLATVPPRDTVQLTIYNSEDITLVRETRSLSLKVGVNRIQYSWAGTLIDPTSVEIRPLEKADSIEVLDTTFPGSKPQHLIWNIESKIEDEVKFQVTYFTSGISWAADYVLVADKDEKEMSLDGYVSITNNSGEDYADAQVRLVVGTINLVEKIADLARRGLVPSKWLEEMNDDKVREAKGIVLSAALGWEAAYKYEGDIRKPPEIVKEGLSEYFIYTIEGTQTVPDKWTRRMVSFRARQVDFDILYRLRDYQYGMRPVRFFILKNDSQHKLGTTPLPDGLVRTFRDNGRDGLAFLGRQKIAYVPIKDTIELNVGTDDSVTSDLKATAVKRANFTFERRGRSDYVVGWDGAREILHRIRNSGERAIRIEVRRVLDGDVEVSAEGAALHDFHTVEYVFDVKPHQDLRYQYSYVEHLGKNAHQNRIVLR